MNLTVRTLRAVSQPRGPREPMQAGLIMLAGLTLGPLVALGISFAPDLRHLPFLAIAAIWLPVWFSVQTARHKPARPAERLAGPRFWPLTCIFLAVAAQASAAVQTNAAPPRTTVAVMRWLAAEPPPMAPDGQHWLRTFTRLVADELLEIAALRVVPEEAVVRELHRQKLDEHLFEQPNRTNAGVGLRIFGTNLQVSWLISGTLARTGTVWTAQARVVDARSGKFKQDFAAASSNWFELRNQVVWYVLRCLDIVPSPAEEKRLGKAITACPQALDWFSRALSEAKDGARAVELCRKALAEDPQFTEARGLLAAGLYNLGRDDEALRVARETLSQQPGNFTAARMRLLSAYVLLGQGLTREAQDEVAEGLRRCPDSAQLLALLSALHERGGDRNAARDYLRKASECDPRNPRLYALLGRLQAMQGDLTNALDTLQLAQRLVVDDSALDDVDTHVALA